MSKRHIIWYHDFGYQADSWERPRRVMAKVEWHRGELFSPGGLHRAQTLRQGQSGAVDQGGQVRPEPDAALLIAGTVANQVQLQFFIVAHTTWGTFCAGRACPRQSRTGHYAASDTQTFCHARWGLSGLESQVPSVHHWLVKAVSDQSRCEGISMISKLVEFCNDMGQSYETSI